MIRRPRWLALFVTSFAVSSLAACGGNSTTTTPFTLTAATAVLGQPSFTTANANYPSGAASATGLSSPTGIAYDSASGEFFVADKNNSRVLGYSTVPTATNAAANFVIGQPDFTTSAAGSPTTQTNFAFPNSVSVGFDSNVNTNKLVVADTAHNRVLIWNSVPSGNIPPDVVIGQSDFVSFKAANPPTSSSLSAPAAATIANGQLFVADTGNSRVLIWNVVPTTIPAPPADLVLGQVDFVHGFPNSAPNSATQGTEQANTMNLPQGIWSDGFRLLVADTSNNRVLYWPSIPSTNQQNATNVLGQSSFTFSTSAVSSQTMNGPTGVSSDGARIFVADVFNNRVLVFNSFQTNNGSAANEVLGQENFTHNTFNDDNGKTNDPQTGVSQPNPTQRTLNGPQNMLYVSGKLYVLDATNNRIMIFDGVNIPVPGNS